MEIRGMDFIQYYVENMQQAIKFYQDTLKLELLSNYQDQWVEFKVGSIVLALCGPELAYPDPPAPSAGRIALAVEDIKEASSKLQDIGVEVEEIHESSVCYMAGFKDPYGNHLLLHERKDGTCG